MAYAISSSTIRADDVARGTLDDLHYAILDGIRGENGVAASRSIPRILCGIVPVSGQPKATDSLVWTNEQTGHDPVVSVRHAIEHAQYIDVNRRFPLSIRARIGPTFDADPTQILFEDQAPMPNQDAEDETQGAV